MAEGFHRVGPDKGLLVAEFLGRSTVPKRFGADGVVALGVGRPHQRPKSSPTKLGFNRLKRWRILGGFT